MKNSHFLLKAVYVILVLILDICTYKITYKLLDYRSNTLQYTALADKYTRINSSPGIDSLRPIIPPAPRITPQQSIPTPAPGTTLSEPAALEEKEKNPDEITDDGTFPIEVNFEDLLKENDDIVGWIYLPDTKIDYPVVRGPDNDYYLHKNINGDYSYAGSIFMDASNHEDWSSRNNILYGHNMNDGSMFHSIIRYKDQKTYDNQPYLFLATPDGNYRLDIFSGFITESESEAYSTFFTEQESFVSWYKKMASKSTIRTNISPNPESRILMLSTCTYERENMRYVLMMIMRPIVKEP